MAKDERSSIGRNTIAGKELMEGIDQIERLRSQKKELGEREKAVFADMKARGFNPKRIREVLKRREMKPLDLQEAQQELDMYLHACGMDSEAPLFRAVGLMGVDTAVREQVIAAFEQLVPNNGEIIVKVGGKPVRIARDKKGVVTVEDYCEPAAPAAGASPAAAAATPGRAVPECSEAEAFAMGEAAFGNNEPVTANPFPWDDPRRERFDAGWRKASGSDGMGPDT